MLNDLSNPLDNLFGAIQKMNVASRRFDEYVREKLPVVEMESFRERCMDMDQKSLSGYLEYFEELEMYEHCAVVKALLETA